MKRKKMNKYGKYIGTAAVSIVMASCSVPRYAELPAGEPLPGSFTGNTDSISMARLSYEELFPDRHLKQVTDRVLAQNPDMKIALQRLEVAGAYRSMSRGALLPSLHMDGRAGGTRFGKYTIDGVGNFDTNLSPNIDEDRKTPVSPTPDFWLGLSTSWEIDLWGRLKNMKKAAQLRYLSSAEGTKLVRTTLAARATVLYYELVALDREAEILHENIRLQEKALDVVEAQKAGGRATELAVQQFRAQLLNTRAASLRISRRTGAVENALNALSGRYEGKIERGPVLMPASVTERLKAGIPAQLLQYRPDLQQAQMELAATRADVRAARAAFFPSLNISAYTAFNAFKPNLLFSAGSLGYQFLGGLTAPVFQKNQIRGQFRIANATQEEAFYQYQKAVLNAYHEVGTLLLEIENGNRIYHLKQQEAAALQQGVEVANDLYVTGYASYLEIVSAQKGRLEAQLELISTQKEMAVALVELYRALGGGF